MAKESGVNIKLQVSAEDSPETWVDVAGQRDTQMQGSASVVDIADKSSGGWGASLAGPRSVSVTCAGVANWPDTNGLELLRSRWDPGASVGASVRCKLVLNAAGAAYVGDFHITEFSATGTHDGSTNYSVTLQNAGALDYLAA